MWCGLRQRHFHVMEAFEAFECGPLDQSIDKAWGQNSVAPGGTGNGYLNETVYGAIHEELSAASTHPMFALQPHRLFPAPLKPQA